MAPGGYDGGAGDAGGEGGGEGDGGGGEGGGGGGAGAGTSCGTKMLHETGIVAASASDTGVFQRLRLLKCSSVSL